MPASPKPKSRFEQARPHYAGLVHHIARTRLHLIPGMDQEELENELLEVLWLACNAYDPTQGCDFKTFFWSKASNHVVSRSRTAKSLKRGPNVKRLYLSEEGVTEAVEAALTGLSAEDAALARISALQEIRVLRKRQKKPLKIS